MENDFYVYEHWRPDLNVCFWVGMGHGKRAYEARRRNKNYDHVVDVLANQGLLLEVKIVKHGLSEVAALRLETRRIRKWRAVHSLLTNIKLVDGSTTRGRKLTEEHRTRISIGNTGKQMSIEARVKISKAAANRTPETLEKISKALAGRTLTPEHVAKLKAAIRPPHTEEHKAKMREGQARRAPRTEEHKARIAAAITAWHAQRKQEQ